MPNVIGLILFLGPKGGEGPQLIKKRTGLSSFLHGSGKRGEPDWALLGLPGAKDLPAVSWKLENLAKLSADKRAQLLNGLSKALGIKES